jgi:hypothetical protein
MKLYFMTIHKERPCSGTHFSYIHEETNLITLHFFVKNYTQVLSIHFYYHWG